MDSPPANAFAAVRPRASRRCRADRDAMKADLRVMVFCGSYPPGFRGGGAARSIVNMVRALADEVDFRVVTLDRDHGSRAPYPDVTAGDWHARDGAQVLYLSPASVSMRRLARDIADVDPSLIYLNSVFDRVFTLRVLMARYAGLLPEVPVLLAPRGEFSSGALSLSRLRKRTFITVARLARLCEGVSWLASTEIERRDILGQMPAVPGTNVSVATDLTEVIDAAPPEPRRRAAGAALRVCFLSRISPVKNLDFALRVLADVSVPVEFSIHGPVEDDVHWARCRELIAGLPSHVRAEYVGAVDPEDVRRTLAEHDLVFLPTRGENFGHVIFEALSAGVPVLISDQTLWRDLAQHGVGWSLPLQDPQAFARAIECASRQSPEDRAAAARKAHRFALEHANRSGAIRRTYDVLRSLARP